MLQREWDLTQGLCAQCLIPVVMSGIIAVYSLVIAVLIAEDMAPPSTQSYSLFKYGIPLHRRGLVRLLRIENMLLTPVAVVSAILAAVLRWV